MSSLLPLQGLAPVAQSENLWDSSSRYKLPTTAEEDEKLVENLQKDFERINELQANLEATRERRKVSADKIIQCDLKLSEVAAKQAEIQGQRAEIHGQRAEIQGQRAEIQTKRAGIQQRRAEIQKELNTGPSDAALLARLAKIRAAKAQALAQTKQ